MNAIATRDHDHAHTHAPVHHTAEPATHADAFTTHGAKPAVVRDATAPAKSASDRAFCSAGAQQLVAAIDGARADKHTSERIMLALEDARASLPACDDIAHVELPARLDPIDVTRAELDDAIAYEQARSGVARSCVATTGPERMAPLDVLYEQMAHPAEGHVLDETWLAGQGYAARGPAKQAAFGLTFRVFVPLPGVRTGARPVVAFYGTDMSDSNDLAEDAMPQGIGWRQCEFNRGLLRTTLTTLSSVYGPVAVAGHSLGGANAQNTAAMFPDLVDSIHTYQSPGICKENLDRLKAHNADPHAAKIRSTHYRVDEDFVETVGDGYTEGTFKHFEVPISNNLLSPIEDAKRRHDTMLATRAWLANNPDSQRAHGDLATSPTLNGTVIEHGESSTADYTPDHEAVRKNAAGPDFEAHVNAQKARIDLYRKAVDRSHDLGFVFAMVDADKDLPGHQGHPIWDPDGGKLFRPNELQQVKIDLWFYAESAGENGTCMPCPAPELNV